MKYFLITLFVLVSLVSSGQSSDADHAIYEADENGSVIQGDIDVLISEIRKGKTLRVGWSMGPIEHWTDAGFISIIGKTVFAQIEGIFQQAPSLANSEKERPSIDFASKEEESWVAIISTTGEMKMNWKFNEQKLREHFATDEEFNSYLNGLKESRIKTKWVIDSN